MAPRARLACFSLIPEPGKLDLRAFLEGGTRGFPLRKYMQCPLRGVGGRTERGYDHGTALVVPALSRACTTLLALKGDGRPWRRS
jgi:hypothetical protein